MIKKAMILAAGFGKRIHPLTLKSPKPLLKIGNETLLSNTLKFLELFGIKQVVINVHYLAKQIVDYINKKKFNLSITIVEEKNKILGTGGGVLNAINYFLNEPFLIINPDTIWNSHYLKELKLMEKTFFENKKSKCSLLVVNKEKSFDQSFKGDFNLENNLISRKDKNDLNYIYVGLQIIKPEVFSGLDLKVFSINKIWDKLIKNFNFSLTADQKRVIQEINYDLKSDYKMFRILQGDVGSGKTIVSLIAASNVIRSNCQVALMAPTEILAKQHYNLATKIFKSTGVTIEFLTSKSDAKEKKLIQENLTNGKIKFLIGTHALFQKKILFNNLGLIIIDEQHKFGVKQRIELSNKGGRDCDILLMSATPIPRTLVLAIYGDMDVSRLIEKPMHRKSVITLSKPEEKIDEILVFIKKQIKNGNQVFWVCPLIEESKKLDYSAAVKKYNY